MSSFNLTWRRYGLKSNPYFNAPLSKDGSALDLSAFTGREKERAELKSVFEMGGEVRCVVAGEPGAGKTSLVNFVRDQAAIAGFFTPANEIEVNRAMTGNELIILTISAIYDEVKRQGISLGNGLMNRLEALYELTRYGEFTHDVASIAQLNRQRLISLFKEVVNAVVHPRYKGVIIHYDNLDNVEDSEGLVDLLSDVRDFLLMKDVVFAFVGDSSLPEAISRYRRVSQTFLTPHLQLNLFSLQEVTRIMSLRADLLKINDGTTAVMPHSEDAIKTLYGLYGGNLREILNSLMSCMVALPPSNTPITITNDLLRDVLSEKAKNSYLSRTTHAEKDILHKILTRGPITPTEIAKLTGKSPQNVSSKYLKNLKRIGAVTVKENGRTRHYEASPEMKWWKLARKESEIAKSRTASKEKISKSVHGKLDDLFSPPNQ